MTMLRTIRFPFADGACERVTGHGEAACRVLRWLSRLMNLELTDAEENAPDASEGAMANPSWGAVHLTDVPFAADKGWTTWTGTTNFHGEVLWQPQKLQWHMLLGADFARGEAPRVMRRVLNLVIFRHCLLADTTLMHGALLLEPDTGQAVVLFGESGIGKSTSARRFAEQGGVVLSDDKLTLTRLADGSYRAQPLPTWSRLGQGDISVRFTESVPVAAVMKLTRGHGDLIRAAETAQWRLWLTSSYGASVTNPVGWLSSEFAARVVGRCLASMRSLEETFGCHELLGDLQGQIRNNLRKFLNERNILSSGDMKIK